MKEWEEYRDTGMLGTYHPRMATLRLTEDGDISTVYRDTVCWQRGDGMVHERNMLIRGKVFRVSSIFSAESTHTPTEKMLSLIDAELSKECHGA